MMKRDFPSFLLYAFGFLLLWEWLRPIEQLTETAHIETFILFLLLAFTASFFRLKWFWQSIIKILFILVSIKRIHYQEEMFQVSWLKAFFIDLIANADLIFARSWSDISNEFRTLLFFILLWLMVYLIHYWLINRQKIFLFFFMTLVYITVLDTFTLYSAKIAIVRTVAIGFAVMGMLTYYRILTKENVSFEQSFTRSWMRPLAFMIAMSVLIGIAAPKAAPIWPDPVPYFQAADNNEDGNRKGMVAKVGYGTNDSRLGGPFIADDSVVFRSEADQKNYWKVETKDTYTGKGWMASGSTPYSFSEEELVPVFSFPAGVETLEDSAKLFLYMDYPHLIYPAGIQKVHNLPDYHFEIDTTKEKISVFDANNQPVAPKAYTVDYKIPKYKVTDLRKTTEADPSQVGPEYIAKYTQLPEEYPERIKQLAEEITAGENNWFDKAKAIERYFSRSDYSYDQKEVAIPGKDDDYVDQFLFETKRGYCDNFSTSMAVMLRTLDIPTRWVKGYTGGEFFKYSENDSSKQLYEITNNNAHSWVEVYFPNQGWVPFEPTQGFRNDVSISYLEDGQTNSSSDETTPSPAKKPEPVKPKDSGSKKDAKQPVNLKEIWLNIKLFMKNNWKMILLITLILGGAAGGIYRIRGKWVPYYFLMRFRFKKSDENIAAAYLILLGQFHRYGLKRKENQTLRDYARYIDSFFSTKEMTRLTAQYEQYLYHQQLPKGSWKDTRELWENLIKRTIA